jgi:hypothetical protein
MRYPPGRQWTAFVRSVVDYYGGICHICKHGGAKQADHLEPRTERPGAPLRIADFRPAHGAPGNPCPVCTAECGRKIHCNQLRGAMSVERARRIIAEYAQAAKTGRPVPVRDTGYAAERAREAARPARTPPPGRPW